MISVFSENPENDLWRELLQFSYEANINRYLSKKGLHANGETINCIVGSFLQADEYYRAAKDANLQISPLLLYYGTTNLLYGMVNLLSGRKNIIANHGMKIFVPEHMSFIADTTIRFLSPSDGGVHVIARAIGFSQDLTNFGDWSLSEFLDSIAEISSDFIQCYEVNAGRVAMLEDVEGFDKSYLRLSVGKERETSKGYFILRHKLTGKDISEESYSGQRYLRAGHNKNSQMVTVPTVLNMYVALFTLASLCRYYPERWSPFVMKDTTGEKVLIEKFLYFARRLIPNYVLNRIMGDKVQYTSGRYSEIDTVKLVGEHQVQEMVERQIRNQFEKQKIMLNSSK